MQELALAPEIVLVAGNHQLACDSISRFLGDRPLAAAFHVSYRYGAVGKLLDKAFGPQKIEHQRKIARRLLEGTSGNPSTLLDVLARFEANRASDPRDYVYSLLGLVEEDTDIQVDYTKTLAQLFTHITLYIINKTHTLDIVCQTAWMSRLVSRKPQPISWYSDSPRRMIGRPT